MQMFILGHQEEDRRNYTKIELIGVGGYGNVYRVRQKLAGGPHYREKVYAMKITPKFRKNVELEVFQQADNHPYLLQLVTYFETKVRSSYLNVSVFRQLLKLKFTMTI
jgi:serine/threonine protein kinase